MDGKTIVDNLRKLHIQVSITGEGKVKVRYQGTKPPDAGNIMLYTGSERYKKKTHFRKKVWTSRNCAKSGSFPVECVNIGIHGCTG